MLGPDQISKHFSQIESIGASVDSGGQKSVYPCSIAGTQYALKLIKLPPAHTDDEREMRESVRQRVVRETEIMNKIDNPHLVRPGPIALETFEEDSLEYLCFSEEWIDGDDIAARVTAHDLIDSDEFWKLNREMISVIANLWDNRLLHRDISARNIMIRKNGDFVLIDLGYAFDFLAPSLTKHHGAPGSLHYMAPERFNLAKKRSVDHRADQFSLGVVAYVALTGTHPYLKPAMDSDQYIDYLCNSRVPPTRPSAVVSGVDKDVENYLGRLIARQPHFRYKSCDAALKAIQSASGGA